MNEFQAALGLKQLESIDANIAARSRLDARYRDALAGLQGIRFLEIGAECTWNFAYFPIFVQPEYGSSRDTLFQRLREGEIYARRYFYPLITQFPTYRGLPSAVPGNLPVATRTAEQVICLPIYPGLTNDDQDRVIAIVRSV